MGKKHQKHQLPPPSADPGSLEEQAAQELQAGRFRKARDLYKILCKTDRAKYLPGLIAANRSLALQLMEKGQAADAQQVIAYLKTIAPASELAGLELDAALGASDWAAAVECALRVLSQPGVRLEGPQANQVADALILAFPEEQTRARLPEPFKTELKSILEALRGISEERYEQAQDLIRPLPRGSIFAQWKMFIKAMLAFYGNDAAKAKALFKQLPAGGVIERAATGFGLFLGAPLKKPDSPQVVAACQLLGVPELAAPLCRAEEAWKKGRFIDSYKELRAAPGFPSVQPSLAGALSEFFMKAGTVMPSHSFWPYVSFFDKLSFQKVFKNPDEGWLVYRMLIVEMELGPGGAPLDLICREFIKRIPPKDPLKNKIASMVLERAGKYFGENEEPIFGFGFSDEDELRDGEKAVELLEESIALDSSNLGAHLKLLDIYEKEKLKGERNRLLDKMTTLFPRSKAVMLRAGRECIARKTWGKGLDYLQRARDLDTLDPEVLRELVDSLTKMARQYYEKGALPKARQAFERAYQHALPNKPDFDRGLGFLKARQALLEVAYGDEAIGKRLLDEARTESGSLPALLLFARSFGRSLGRKVWKKIAPVEETLEWAQPANALERRSLILALDYTRPFDQGPTKYAETDYVARCLQSAMKNDITQEEALDLIALFKQRADFAFIVQSLIKKGLTLDPKHPRFRFYKLSQQTYGNFRDHKEELEAIRDEAIARGDSGTLKLVGGILDSFRHGPRGVEDEDDWDEEDEFDEPPSPEEAAALLPPELIEGLKQKLGEMDEDEFEAFRKTSDLPPEFFDFLSKLINQPISRSSGKSRSKADPNQTEFF